MKKKDGLAPGSWKTPTVLARQLARQQILARAEEVFRTYAKICLAQDDSARRNELVDGWYQYPKNLQGRAGAQHTKSTSLALSLGLEFQSEKLPAVVRRPVLGWVAILS
jgi:hypothetical protein